MLLTDAGGDCKLFLQQQRGVVQLDRDSAGLAVAVASLILQVVAIWQNRKRKPKGKHSKD